MIRPTFTVLEQREPAKGGADGAGVVRYDGNCLVLTTKGLQFTCSGAPTFVPYERLVGVEFRGADTSGAGYCPWCDQNISHISYS